MARKGTKKALSVEQEEFVAQKYGAVRSKSSGAADTDAGDVRSVYHDTLFECKGKFGERCGETPVRSTLVKDFEKIWDEAHAEGREPAMALRFYMPESPLANSDGWVDFTVRLLEDDAHKLNLLGLHKYS